jgi:D-apiose dehydrogenase
MKRLGAPGEEVEYERTDVNFASDCVYALERHFVECMRSGVQFESNGEDYLKTVQVVDAAYESAARGQVVRL